MKKVCIQAGHLNIKNNCVVSLRGATGAGGEVSVTEAVMNALAPMLKAAGITVTMVDGNYNCVAGVSSIDYDLFISLHCDMDYAGDQGSGFADFPEPSTDGATAESQRLTKAIQDSFFKEVGISVKSRSNANTRYYYMWASLSAKTPCVLIEMGQVQDAHDSVILKNTMKVAQALCNAILKSLGITAPATGDTVESLKAALNNLQIRYDSEHTTRLELEKAKLIRDAQLRDAVKNLNEIIGN